MKHQIQSFLHTFSFPAEAADALLTAFDNLAANPAAFSKFMAPVHCYFDDTLTDYAGAIRELEAVAQETGIHKYTIWMLFFIALTPHARQRYAARHLPNSIFYNSMSDLKYKLLECHKLHGVWGTMAADWYPRFFALTRFALGRLQFETTTLQEEYEKNGRQLSKDDIVVNIHIPSSGPLRHEDCLDAYRQAAAFFQADFPGCPVAFVCNSWLLYPAHRPLLPAQSNIVKFMDDFEILSIREDAEGRNLWRIFNVDYHGDWHCLPQETTLQKAYVSLLKNGQTTGTAKGVFFHDGERILPREE